MGKEGIEMKNIVEQRKANVILSKAGGTAGIKSLNSKISLPKSWVNEMGITLDDRQVCLSFDGEKILIEKNIKTT